MELKRRYIFQAVAALIVITVVAAFTWLSSGRARASRPDVRQMRIAAVVPVSRTALETKLRLSGEFRPYQEVDVHAKVAGYIQHIYVDVGDHVQQGQSLAVLEVPELNAEVAGAKADIQRSKDAIRKAENDVQRAESAHAATHSAYSRLKQASAAKPGLIAEQELDDAFAKDQESEAQVGSSQAGLAEARSELNVAEANQQHYAALEAYAQITAPFSGVITKRYADTGALIQAGTSSSTQSMPVVRLAQWSRLRLVLPVPESAVPDLHLGQSVAVRVPSLNRTFQGKIARFADELSDETRTMHAEIDVENPDGTLVNGMYAETDLQLKHPQASLTVPIQAVKRDGDNGKVMVVRRDGVVEEHEVKLGSEGSEQIEILSGIGEGDRVIVGNLSEFQTGDKVQPKLIVAGGQTEGDQH